MSCCSRVFFATNRMFRCCTAVQIASASLLSFFCRRTNGFTYCGSHDLHRVTELLELPLPRERTGGGFDADDARLQFAKDLQQLFAANPTYQYGASLPVDTV